MKGKEKATYRIVRDGEEKWTVKEAGQQYGQDLAGRLFQFAVDLIKYLKTLPNAGEVRDLQRQLFKAGTSAGANYEEAQGAISKEDFSSKCAIVLKESREANFWLRLIKAAEIDDSETLNRLTRESKEFIAIFTTIVKKTRPRTFNP